MLSLSANYHPHPNTAAPQHLGPLPGCAAWSCRNHMASLTGVPCSLIWFTAGWAPVALACQQAWSLETGCVLLSSRCLRLRVVQAAERNFFILGLSVRPDFSNLHWGCCHSHLQTVLGAGLLRSLHEAVQYE